MPSAAQNSNQNTINQRYPNTKSLHQQQTQQDKNSLKNKNKKFSKQQLELENEHQIHQQQKQQQQQQQQQQKQMNKTKKPNPIDKTNTRTEKNDENSIDGAIMIAPKNFVQRKNFYGPIYELDHLATFTVGSKNGLLKAEDGMRKLRNMEKLHGVWTLECQLLIDSNYLVVYDKKTGQEVEVFPLELVTEPTSVVSDDKRDAYNNIVLFTILEDNRKQKSHTSSSPTEMHIFQSTRAHSTEIVDEILKAKTGGVLPSHRSDAHKLDEPRKYVPTTNEILNNNVYKQRAAHLNNIRPNNRTSQVDFDVQILNHCFDDIERFITRLQNSLDSYRELEKRKKDRKSHNKVFGDGMLTMRSQMPSIQNFVDIFQKIKLSFNLLAKLKAHIHDPNAPELVHFLFTPLALIVNTTREQPYQGIGKTVWTPLMTKDAKELLLNCLTSKEQDLWMSLGDGWTTTLEEAKKQPAMYSNLNNDAYSPVFYDGWAPILNTSQNEADRDDLEKLAMESVAHIQANSHKYNQPLPIQKSRYYSNTQPLSFEEQQKKSSQNQQATPIRNYDEMKKWASDLAKQSVKVSEVIHDRQANNDKELTVKAGELVEVLDDKRNWWRLKNFYGHIGHAPVTILRPFELTQTQSNDNQLEKNSDGKQQSSILVSSSSLSSSSNLDNSDSKTKLNSQPEDKNQIIKSNFRNNENTKPYNPEIVKIEKHQTPRINIEKINNLIEKPNQDGMFQSMKTNIKSQPDSDKNFLEEIQPLKGMLYSQVERRMSKERRSELSFIQSRDKSSDKSIVLNAISEPSKVKAFIESKGFSNKVVLMFGELNGAQIFSLNREDFEKFCGKEEGIRLDSHIKIQKSLCGYENQTTELSKILERRKEKSEHDLNKI